MWSQICSIWKHFKFLIVTSCLLCSPLLAHHRAKFRENGDCQFWPLMGPPWFTQHFNACWDWILPFWRRLHSPLRKSRSPGGSWCWGTWPWTWRRPGSSGSVFENSVDFDETSFVDLSHPSTTCLSLVLIVSIGDSVSGTHHKRKNILVPGP